MTEQKRPLYAKFKHGRTADLFSEFIISNDIEKTREWTGSDKGAEQTTKESKDISNDAVNTKEGPSGGAASDEVTFENLTEVFLTAINDYYQFIPRAMGIMPALEAMEIQKTLYEPLSGKGKLIEKGDTWEIYEIDSDAGPYINRTFEIVKAFRGGRKNLPAMFLMGLVSSYDAFLATLLRAIFAAKPDWLSSSERNISFRDLIELGSIENAKEQMIDKEIESVLRMSHHAQIEWLEKRLDAPLRKNLRIWPNFVELFERRNLFTHTGGVVSQQYLSVCKQHGCDVSEISPGQQLRVTTKYLRGVIATLSEFGLKLIQVVWRILNPEQIDGAEATLSHVGFRLIAEGRYRLALEMLDFGLNTMKKHGSEKARRRMVINFANANKLVGDTKKSKEILDAEDWSASGDLYKLCVAAVSDDIDEIVKLMPKFVGSEEISSHDFRYWPVFKGLKDDPKFIEAFESNFKEPYFLDIESDGGAKKQLNKGDAAASDSHNKPELLH